MSFIWGGLMLILIFNYVNSAPLPDLPKPPSQPPSLPKPSSIPHTPCVPGRPGCNDPFPPGRQDTGDAWWAIGDARFNVFLKSVTTMLKLPQPPQGSPGAIVLNPALDNSNTQVGSAPFNQTFEAFAAALPVNACNQTSNQWCLFDSLYYKENGQGDTSPGCESVPVKPQGFDAGVEVNITYEYDSTDRSIDESVGAPSALSESSVAFSGLVGPFQFWPRTECACEAKGTVPEHSYFQTTITLNKAVPDFNTSVRQNNTNQPRVYTSDGGVTWHIDTLTLAQSQCNNQNPCDTAPAMEICPSWHQFLPHHSSTNSTHHSPQNTSSKPSPSPSNTSNEPSPSPPNTSNNPSLSPQATTHASTSPKSVTTSTTSPQGVEWSSASPEKGTEGSASPQGVTQSTASPDGAKWSSDTPNGVTETTAPPEGIKYPTFGPHGITESSAEPDKNWNSQGSTGKAGFAGGEGPMLMAGHSMNRAALHG